MLGLCVCLQRFTGNQISKLHQSRVQEFQDTEVRASLSVIQCCVSPAVSHQCVFAFRGSHWSAALQHLFFLVAVLPLTTAMVQFDSLITDRPFNQLSDRLNAFFRFRDESVGHQDQELVRDLSRSHCSSSGQTAGSSSALSICTGKTGLYWFTLICTDLYWILLV